MCEILVYNKNQKHPDPIIDRTSSYTRGMPVVIFDDGHNWGRNESKRQWINEGLDVNDYPNDFIILKIPGLPEHKIKSLIKEQNVDDFGVSVFNDISVDITNGPDLARYRRREWKVLFDTVTTVNEHSLSDYGEMEINSDDIKIHIKRIRDNEEFKI